MTLCTFGPPAERERRWILKFEDADVGDMHFAAEPDAMRAFERYSGAFTCTLFVTATFINPDRRCVACGQEHIEGCWGASMPDLSPCKHIDLARSRATP